MFLFYTSLYFSFLESQDVIIDLIWVMGQKVWEKRLYIKNKHMKDEARCGVVVDFVAVLRVKWKTKIIIETT